MSISDDVSQQVQVDELPVFEDYFGFSSSEVFLLPDGKQYIEFQIMNEGTKSKFQKLTQRDVVVERATQNARLKVDPAQERHELIRSSVTGWNLYRQGTPVLFSKKALGDFLELSNPKLIEDLEKAIRKANPWLMAEMSVEDIDREIESLQEMREVAVKRELGESNSSSK